MDITLVTITAGRLMAYHGITGVERQSSLAVLVVTVVLLLAGYAVARRLVIMRDGYLQLKLLFILLAGINLLAFYLTGAARTVDALGPGDDAPPLAKIIAGTSLFLWVGVIVFGRLIPEGL